MKMIELMCVASADDKIYIMLLIYIYACALYSLIDTMSIVIIDDDDEDDDDDDDDDDSIDIIHIYTRYHQ